MALTLWHVSMKVVTDKRFTYFRSHLLFIVVVLFHQGHCQVYIEVTIRAHCAITGAPNENIVQNHLNIALLNVFKYLNGRYRHIFIS